MEAPTGAVRPVLRVEDRKVVGVRVPLLPPMDARIGALNRLESGDGVTPVGVRVPQHPPSFSGRHGEGAGLKTPTSQFESEGKHQGVLVQWEDCSLAASGYRFESGGLHQWACGAIGSTAHLQCAGQGSSPCWSTIGS